MTDATDITLEERLNLLEHGGVIDAKVRSVVEGLVSDISVSTGRALDSPTGHMCVTHLAMALKRVMAGEAVSEMPPGLEHELADHQEDLALARHILARASDELRIELPQSEVYLVAMYIAALQQEARG